MKVFLVFAALFLFITFTLLVLTNPISQDEGVFLTIGKYLNRGFLLYQDLFDHKPPAIYFLFTLLFKFFGTSVFVAKFVLILSVLVSTALVGMIGEMLKKGTGWYAAGMFLFLMTQFEGYFLTTESFLLLPLLLSLLLLIRKQRNGPWLFLAGISLSIAVSFKQTAVLSALPLLVIAYRAKSKGKLTFTAGLLLPAFVLGGYLLVNDLMSQAFHQIVTLTLTRYPREPFPFVLQALRTNFFWTLPIWVLFLLGFRARVQNTYVLWVLALLPLPFMFVRHYPHYWVQLLPFVAILAATALVHLRHGRTLAAAAIAFCIFVSSGKVAQDAGPNLRLLNEQRRVARILNQEPTGTLLVENQFTGFYFLLSMQPLNKYLYITEITNAEGAEQRTIEDLPRGQDVMVLWPEDLKFAYAKKLQAFILEHSTTSQEFSILGMRVLHYRPAISQ